ncbi:MAG: S24/S26 family peptidase [Clostridia bacterium]|nr:S24/S26 family peptidase [Clostridia bacterium]MEE1023835.1 S24/S26 family peptidase [Acutalibacteraceae bacterium]
MIESLSMNDMYPLITEVIESGGVFRLWPRGTSMMPLLRQGEDSVSLALPENVEVGDIVLYRRKNGQFVLHRIISIADGGYTMCGDNQYILERGISYSQLIAKVVGIYRGEQYFDVGNLQYSKYVKHLPHRRIKIRFKTLCYRMRDKIFPHSKN